MAAEASYGRKLPKYAATSEAGYDDEQAAFLKKMDHFKRSFSKPFPTLTEVLWVLKGMGYRNPLYED